MALFPKIETHCPYSDRVAEIVAGDFCRLCQRTVIDLTEMDDAGRARFVATCSPDACVTYRLPVSATIVTAAALAGMAMPLAAAAQDKAATPQQTTVPAPAPAPPAETSYDNNTIVVTGSLMKGPSSTIPVTAISAEDLDADDEDRRPGVIELIAKLFRRKH